MVRAHDLVQCDPSVHKALQYHVHSVAKDVHVVPMFINSDSKPRRPIPEEFSVLFDVPIMQKIWSTHVNHYGDTIVDYEESDQ